MQSIMVDPPMERNGIELKSYRPGALAAVVGLHMDYYASNWGFGLPFETKVAGEMAELLRRFDPRYDLFLCACSQKGEVIGSITIDGSRPEGDLAHLRWYIVAAGWRGQGLGRRLLSEAVAHAEKTGFSGVYLTTFSGLHAAGHLYASFGFRLVRETSRDDWSGDVGMQRYELHFE